MFRYILNSSLGELIIDDAPKGWESKKYSMSRSKTYSGIIITVSAELQFLYESYDYLVELDTLEDSEAVCTIEIQRYANAIIGWKKAFISNLDFNKKKIITKDGKFISFPTYSDDFSYKILQRDEIEIPYDRLTTLDDVAIIPFENEYYTVAVEGIETLDKTKLNINEFIAPTDALWYPSISAESNAAYWIPTTYQAPLFPLSEEDININAFFVSDNSLGVISGVLELKITTSSQAIYSISVDDYKTNIDRFTPINIYNISGQATFPTGETIITIPIVNYNFDEYTRILLRFSKSGGIIDSINFSSNDVQVVSKAKATDCNFVPPFEIASRLVNAMTGELNAVNSDFFGRTDSPIPYDEDGKGSLLFETNGKLIRGFPTGQVITEEDKVSQLSFKFKEWFTNNEKIYNIGAGVEFIDDEYKLRIEDKKYFYGSDVILEIGRDIIEHGSFTRERDTSMYYGAISTGSQFEKPEEVSGLEEYNNIEHYSGVLVNSNILDLVSTYIYGAYPWEFTRRKPFVGTETEDYRYDNNNFMMVMKRDGEDFIQKTNEGFDKIEGLDFVTSPINLDITPQRNLRNNWGWLISTGYRVRRDTKLKYNTSEVVTDLVTKRNDEANDVVENGDIPLNQLESAFFSGNIDRFNAPLSGELFDLLRANPYGLIKYWNESLSDWNFGWIQQVSTEPVDSSTNWEMINGYGITDIIPPYRLLEDGSLRLLEDGGIRLLE